MQRGKKLGSSLDWRQCGDTVGWFVTATVRVLELTVRCSVM